jgi:hypothetical protein
MTWHGKRLWHNNLFSLSLSLSLSFHSTKANGRSILAMNKCYMIVTTTTLSTAITRFRNVTDVERIKVTSALLGILRGTWTERSLSDWLPPGMEAKAAAIWILREETILQGDRAQGHKPHVYVESHIWWFFYTRRSHLEMASVVL